MIDSEAFQDALKDFMANSQTGCPWLAPNAPPTASEIAFAWPSPRLEHAGRQATHCVHDDTDYTNLFNLFDMNGDGLVDTIDFRLFKVVWGVQIPEDVDGGRAINFTDFINVLSSLPFKVGEPLCHTVVYRLVNGHPRKEALLQAHINKLIAKIRQSHWGKVQNLINEDKIKDSWMIFCLFDMNGDGRLTSYDLRTFILIWGWCPTGVADLLDKLAAVDGTIDFLGFVNLIDILQLQIEEPLYHFAVFSLIDYHLQVAFIPEDKVWNLSAKIRRNFCRREKCSLMEYRFRSCKLAFSLCDIDGDGLITRDDLETLSKAWVLGHSLYGGRRQVKKAIDFESFVEEFSSINMSIPYDFTAALNLLRYHECRGLLPRAAICHFCKCLQRKLSNMEEERYKCILRQIFELNRIFSILDYDEDDHLTAKEVETLTRVCELPLAETTDIFDKLYTKWGAKIDFVSLLMLFKFSSMNPFRIMESPSKVFELLDRDGDGFLSAADFERFAFVIGQELSDQEIQRLMFKLDTEGNGLVSCHGFCQAMLETCNDCNDLIPSMLELNVDNFCSSEEVDGYRNHKVDFLSLWELDTTMRNEEAEEILDYLE